jgi:molybdenum cofactor synthesis domain-containing protein
VENVNSFKIAAIIVIGNEILSGKTKDTNTPFLTGELFELGISLKRVAVIPDNIDDIAEEVRFCKSRYNFIFTSGGIGPTHDDVTIEGLAKGTDRKLIRHPILEECIRKYYVEPTEVHYRLAMVPEGTSLIQDKNLPMPIISLDNIFIFPGVPMLLEKQFNHIKRRFKSKPIHTVILELRTQEVKIAESLEQILEEFPDVEIGSYPEISDYKNRVLLTFCSLNESSCHNAKDAMLKRIPADWIFQR